MDRYQINIQKSATFLYPAIIRKINSQDTIYNSNKNKVPRNKSNKIYLRPSIKNVKPY